MKDNSEWIGYGVIQRVAFGNSCTEYYVAVTINGKNVIAQSIYYIYQKKQLHTGDMVRVRCYNLNSIVIRCEILDDELISCSEAVKRDRPKYIVFGAIFLALMIAAFIYDRYFMIK